MTESKSSSRIAVVRGISFLTDFAWLVGIFSVFGSVIFPNSRWRLLTHLGIPLVTYFFYAYFFTRFLGSTPAEMLLGLRRRMVDGRKPGRIYDWLFQSKTIFADKNRSIVTALLLLFTSLIFAAGGSTLLWMRDPTLRPFGEKKVALFAPDSARSPAWDVLPFFYATGAFPRPDHPSFKKTGGLEYSLPYERGPPIRFLGKVVAYWRDFDSRLILSGPVTTAAPSSPQELEECFTSWFRCTSERRKIWKASIGAYFDDRKLVANEWFRVENEFLAPSERPQGLHLESRAEKGRIREAYFIVGPKMAIQGVILDRPEAAEGDAASEFLKQIVGSLRVSGDLQAPRAFLNPKLAALRINPTSKLTDLVAAEALLLAKVSIEPKESETFYHLAGLAVTLYRTAKKEGRIELAATSKMVVTNSLQYMRDVNPKSPRIPEMERFDAEVESK